MWTPLRSPKMYGFIFGFQRWVWWPKCAPASSNCCMVTTVDAMIFLLPVMPLQGREAGASRIWPSHRYDGPACGMRAHLAARRARNQAARRPQSDAGRLDLSLDYFDYGRTRVAPRPAATCLRRHVTDRTHSCSIRSAQSHASSLDEQKGNISETSRERKRLLGDCAVDNSGEKLWLIWLSIVFFPRPARRARSRSWNSL